MTLTVDNTTVIKYRKERIEMTVKLTSKQAELLQIVEAFISDNCYSPTMVELAEIRGVRENAIIGMLVCMRKKGVVNWIDGKSRTLHIPRKVESEL